MKKEKLTAERLKNVVWETLADVRSGEISPQKANSVCASSRAICSIVKLELQVARLSGRKPTTNAKRFTALA